MADNKKSVLLYCDLIHTVEKLDNETAGELFKHYLRYVNDLQPTTNNVLVDIVFEPIKQSLKRDLKKWETRAERSRENGKLGGRPKNQEEPKEPSGLNDNPEEPRKPDTVKVTDTVTVKDKDNNKDKIVTEICNFAWSLFPIDIRPKEKNKNWIDTIDKLIRLDGKDPTEIKAVISWARKDEFWSKNFLSLTKLRIKNKEDVKYYDVFNENRKSNGKGRNKDLATATHFKPITDQAVDEWRSVGKVTE